MMPDTGCRSPMPENMSHRGGDGIGFCLGHEGYANLVGIDCDHCLDAVGNIIDSNVQRWVKALDSYTERTPTETAFTVWVHGTIPVAGQRKEEAGVEIYAKKRYFTVTGLHLKGTPTEIHDRQKAIDALWAELFGDRSKARTRPNGKSNGHPELSDDELIDKARAARTAPSSKPCSTPVIPAITAVTTIGPIQALANLLAFWTNRDARANGSDFRPFRSRSEGQVEGQAGLSPRRPWPAAIAGCKTTYSPVSRNGHTSTLPPGDGATKLRPSTGRDHRPRFANSIPEAGDKAVPVLMPGLIESLTVVGQGWPKRVDETLFVASADSTVYLESATRFSWLARYASQGLLVAGARDDRSGAILRMCQEVHRRPIRGHRVLSS